MYLFANCFFNTLIVIILNKTFRQLFNTLLRKVSKIKKNKKIIKKKKVNKDVILKTKIYFGKKFLHLRVHGLILSFTTKKKKSYLNMLTRMTI